MSVTSSLGSMSAIAAGNSIASRYWRRVHRDPVVVGLHAVDVLAPDQLELLGRLHRLEHDLGVGRLADHPEERVGVAQVDLEPLVAGAEARATSCTSPCRRRIISIAWAPVPVAFISMPSSPKRASPVIVLRLAGAVGGGGEGEGLGLVQRRHDGRGRSRRPTARRGTPRRLLARRLGLLVGRRRLVGAGSVESSLPSSRSPWSRSRRRTRTTPTPMVSTRAAAPRRREREREAHGGSWCGGWCGRRAVACPVLPDGSTPKRPPPTAPDADGPAAPEGRPGRCGSAWIRPGRPRPPTRRS